MAIKLVRNIETARDKNQEDSFESTFNISLYFFSNKIISKIDGWRKSNIKKLIRNLNDDIDLEIHFSKWNENINMLFESPDIELIINTELTDDIKDIISSKDIKKISKLILETKDNKNIKNEMAFYILTLIKDNNKMIIFSNFIINEGVLTVDLLLEILISKLIMEDENE